MSNKTRKRLWPVSLVMAIAIVGVLAAFLMVASSPSSTQAHDGATGDAHCAGLNDFLQELHDGAATDHTCDDPPMNAAPEPGDAIAPLTAIMVGGTAMFDSTIEDPDGDTLTWSVMSSDADVATASVDMGSVTITGIGAGMATITVTAEDPDGESASQSASITVNAPPPPPAEPAVTISGWSSSGGGSETLVIQAANLGDLGIDDSIVLVLDDKFTVPSMVPTGTVFFKEPAGPSGGARVNASVTIDEEDDDFTGDDSHAIRIYVPDMDPADDTAMGITSDTFAIVIDKNAGIKNPTEGEKMYAVGYQLLQGADLYDSAGTQMFADDGSASLGTTADSMVAVRAKVSLDDKNNKRGYELTITGSGFNKDSSATAYVLKGQATAPDCATVVDDGESIGSGTVGGDHKIVITTEVTGGSKGDFSPGNTNYICIRDDNAPTRRVSSAAKAFELEHSIAVEPASVASGEEVTVKLRDYPAAATVTSVSLDGKKSSGGGDFVATRSGSEITFDMPGGVSGTVEVAVTADGASTKTTTITVDPASLSLSQTEVAPNASIIISGSGFNEGSEIPVSNIKMDDEPLVVDDAGTQSCAHSSGECVKVTSSGEFTATVRIWTASSSNANPALDDGEYTVKAKDAAGFEGKGKITVLAPTITVTPDTASPRDFIVISGENWPISTSDDDFSVTIEIDDRTRNADTDGTGRFRYEYQLRASIGIGDEHDVKVSIKDGDREDIEEETTFSVTQAELGIMPAAAAPGQMISVEIQGMPPYTLVDKISIGRVSLLGNQSVTTDREGDATVANITVPFLDPGHYPVEVAVGSETRVAQFEVLAEAAIPGVASTLPDAVSGLGDNLEAIFHFNNTSKAWSFFDPRPEFADLNTLTELNGGQPYWVLVKDNQENVDWNGRLVNFTCAADDCWNLEIW